MKTAEEARKMGTILNDEAENLPNHNLFGDSNLEAKTESLSWAKSLLHYSETGTIPDKEDNPEVYNWVTGKKWSALEDYES